MNYRKWPAQSVLWLITSVSLFVIYVGSDLYRWKVQGKPASWGEFADSLVFCVIGGWGGDSFRRSESNRHSDLACDCFINLRRWI